MPTQKYLTRAVLRKEYFPEISKYAFYQITSKYFQSGKITLYDKKHGKHSPASLMMLGRVGKKLFIKKTDKELLTEIIAREMKNVGKTEKKREPAPDNGIPVYDPCKEYKKEEVIQVKLRRWGWQTVKIFKLFEDEDGDSMLNATLSTGEEITLGHKIGHLLAK